MFGRRALFCQKKIWLMCAFATQFQRINWAKMQPGGLEGWHGSDLRAGSPALAALPLPGTTSEASQGNKHSIFFHLLQRIS